MTAVNGRLLSIEGLSVTIPTREQPVHAIREVSLHVNAGEVVGLVGESGGGKTMLARATIGMLPAQAVTTGSVLFRGHDVLTMSVKELRQHRGHGVAMCFQSPRSALDPMRSVAKQMMDRITLHRNLRGEQGTQVAVELLDRVGLHDTKRILRSYPHELSGGMAQRVMVALCLACDPGLMLADEPTTGLDVTLTGETLGLLRGLADETGRGVVLISHDIAAATRICDRIVVLKAGEIVESGPAHTVVGSPRNVYTQTLLAAVPDIDRPVKRTARRASTTTASPQAEQAIATVQDLAVRFRGRWGVPGHDALQGVSLVVNPGETVGIVGESGSGKSTLARVLLGLVKPSAGQVRVAGIDVAQARGVERRQLRRSVQMVFQDPIGSLDPRRNVLDAVTQTLRVQGVGRKEQLSRAAAVLEQMGLDPSMFDRLPHELSGGQAQRVGIARALVCDPSLIVFDEPTSALDVTVQSQILDLITQLGTDDRRGQIFISHDLATVRSFCDRVLVFVDGAVVEEGSVDDVFSAPKSEFTRSLLASAPRLQAAKRSRGVQTSSNGKKE